MQKEILKVENLKEGTRYFATLTGFIKILNFENRYSKDWIELNHNTLKKKKFPFEHNNLKFSKVEVEREKDLKIEKVER